MSSGVHRWEWPSTQTLWQPQDRLKLGPPACITNALLYQLSYPGIPFTRKDLRSWKTVRFDFYTVGLYGHDPRIGERTYGNVDQSQ